MQYPKCNWIILPAHLVYRPQQGTRVGHQNRHSQNQNRRQNRHQNPDITRIFLAIPAIATKIAKNAKALDFFIQ